MNPSTQLLVEFDVEAAKQTAEVVPLIATSCDQALENLNRITGLQFSSYPQSLVNRDCDE